MTDKLSYLFNIFNFSRLCQCKCDLDIMSKYFMYFTGKANIKFLKHFKTPCFLEEVVNGKGILI